MSRWPVLAVSSILLVGCASSVRPGLANAPGLGSTGVAGEPAHDAISNGDEGCAYREHGPLRGRFLTCAPMSGRTTGFTLLPPVTRAPANGLVVPWLQHYYVGWLCPHAPPAAVGPLTRPADASALALSSPSPAACRAR